MLSEKMKKIKYWLIEKMKKIKYWLIDQLDSLLSLLTIYSLEVGYLLMLLFLWRIMKVVLNTDQILNFLTFFPLPFVAIYYIKKRNNETELTWIDEHINFSEKFLNKEDEKNSEVKSRLLEFRKLIFTFSILKSSKRSSHVKKELFENLYQLIDFILINKGDKIFDDKGDKTPYLTRYNFTTHSSCPVNLVFSIEADEISNIQEKSRRMVVPKSINNIEDCIKDIGNNIVGFQNALGLLYSKKHIAFKYQLYKGLRYKVIYMLKLNEFESLFKDDTVKGFVECEFNIKSKLEVFSYDQEYGDIFYNCIFKINGEPISHSELFVSKNEDIQPDESDRPDDTEQPPSDNTEQLLNDDTEQPPKTTITKKSRDYREIRDYREKDGNNYLAKGWFIIREIDFNTKYNENKNILFRICTKDSVYSIEFTYEQLADLISYKYPDARGNYHFYFWIKQKDEKMYLIDSRNGLNKTYSLEKIENEDEDNKNEYYTLKEGN